MIKANEILVKFRENLDRLSGCDLHAFDAKEFVPAKKMVCKNCGGEMNLFSIRYYIEGYEAAGKSSNDIWPGYRDKKKTMEGKDNV